MENAVLIIFFFFLSGLENSLGSSRSNENENKTEGFNEKNKG